MNHLRIAPLTVALLATLILVAVPAIAADSTWPSRSIRIIVAQAGGGPPDLIARFVAEPLSRALGVPVVVDNGPSAAITAVASGDAQSMVVSVGTGLPLAQAGKIRPLVVFNDRRSPQLPDVPTAKEQSFTAVDLSAWIGLLAPAETPEPVVARLNAEINKILRSPEALAWADRHGLEIIGGSPAAFAATMSSDYSRWGEIIRRLKLRPE